jgi:hypothetical protein
MSTVVNLKERKEKSNPTHNETQTLYLTANQIRAYPKFEDASDEEVLNIINTMLQVKIITDFSVKVY